VSFEEMKKYFDKDLQIRELEDEVRQIKRKQDEGLRDFDRRINDGGRSSKQGNVSQAEINRLEQHIEKRLALMEEQISEKASKQSVAQALHRKVNKPENDEILA